MKNRKMSLVVVGTLCTLLVIVLSWERINLCVDYYRLVSDDSIKQRLSLQPKIEKFVYEKEYTKVLSLGYAELSDFAEKVTRISLEQFPKITVDIESVTLTFPPPFKYGMELVNWKIDYNEKKYDGFRHMTELEKDFWRATATDPYGKRKKMAKAVPLPLIRVITMPKIELWGYVAGLQEKSISAKQSVYFEDGLIMAVYESVTEDNSLLTIYDTEKKLDQTVLLCDGNDDGRLDMARKIVTSFRFTMKSLPEEHDELLQIIREAVSQAAAFEKDSIPVNKENQMPDLPSVKKR